MSIKKWHFTCTLTFCCDRLIVANKTINYFIAIITIIITMWSLWSFAVITITIVTDSILSTWGGFHQ